MVIPECLKKQQVLLLTRETTPAMTSSYGGASATQFATVQARNQKTQTPGYKIGGGLVGLRAACHPLRQSRRQQGLHCSWRNKLAGRLLPAALLFPLQTPAIQYSIAFTSSGSLLERNNKFNAGVVKYILYGLSCSQSLSKRALFR